MRFKNGGREIDMKTIRIDDASQILESDVTHENLKIRRFKLLELFGGFAIAVIIAAKLYVQILCFNNISHKPAVKNTVFHIESDFAMAVPQIVIKICSRLFLREKVNIHASCRQSHAAFKIWNRKFFKRSI